MNVVTTPSDHATDRQTAPPLGEQDRAAANQETVVPSPYRARITIGSLTLCTVLGFLLCLQFGAEAIPFAKSIQVLLSAWFPTHQGEDQFDAETTILLQLRVPRLLLALCVGSTLAIVGATLQALVRNPLADPYVLGVSSGATLGATLAMTSDWLATALDGTGISVAALAGAVLSIIVVYRLSSPGVYDAVEVELGPRVGDFYPVVSGLRAGDQVVARGAFLVDAEARLSPGAAANYFGASASYYAPSGCGNTTWEVSYVGNSWNDLFESGKGFGTCDRNRKFEHSNFGGNSILCTPNCSDYGQVRNRVSSLRWRN